MEFKEFVKTIENDKNLVIVSKTADEMVVRPKFGNRTSQTVRLPLEITLETSFLAGVIIADGHVCKKRFRLDIEMVRKDLLHIIIRKFKEAFNINLKILRKPVKGNRKPCWRIVFQNKAIWLFFTSIFEIPPGKKSETVKVPKCVMRDLSCVKMFFSGLFVGDGGFKHENISFTTSSKALFEGVQEILNKFNISFFTQEWVHNKSKKKIFDVIINKKSTKRFISMFPLLSTKICRGARVRSKG